jgi:hypothetical protein
MERKVIPYERLACNPRRFDTMKLTGPRIAVAAALFSLAILRTTSAAIEPDVEYPAGTKVETPGTEVSFTIPEGWNGILPKGSAFFVLGSRAQKAYIFVMAKKETIAEAKKTLEKSLPLGNGIVLQPTGKTQSNGRTFSGNYSVTGAEQPLTGYVHARVGEGDIGVTYVAISAPETASRVQDIVLKLSEDTLLGQP